MRNVIAWHVLSCGLWGLAGSSRAAGPADIPSANAAFREAMLLPRSVAADGSTRAGYNGPLLIKTVSARLIAPIDVFDALISPRVYKPAMAYPQVRDISAAGRGQHFDPDMTDEFLAWFADFVAIAESHRDGADHPHAEQVIPTGSEV